jgi:hypothetical protein
MPSVRAGIDGIPATTIPDNPTEFVTWFKTMGLPRWFANADVRNALEGAGISITGNLSTPATIGVSANIQSLFEQPYVLVGAPVASAPLTGYRSIATESGVLTLTDGGAEGDITVGVAANGIGNAQLRQSAATSVIGNATSSEANVADIAASANGQVLQMAGGLLTFAALPPGSLGAIGNDTVLGNISGSSAAPSALTLTQLTTLLDPITPTWTGLHTFSPGSGSAIQINAANGSFGAQVISSGSTHQAAIAYSLNGVDTGYIGVDGGQNIFGDSTNGDLCIRSGGNILLGIQQPSPAVTIATSTGNVTIAALLNLSGGMADLEFNGTALQAITPTWNGQHTFDYSGGSPVVLSPAAGYAGATVNSASASEPAMLLYEQGGTPYAEIGTDGSQTMYSGSTNGDIVLRVVGASNNLWVVVDSTVEALKIASSGAVTFAAGVICNTTLTATTGATLTTAVTLGAAAANTVGFYGATPVAQRASTSIQHTSNLSTLTTSASWGTADAAAFNQVVATLSEVANTLHAYGLWSIS